MFKKVFVMMLALVAVPAFALADWTVNASKTPANLTVAAPVTTVGTTSPYGASTRFTDSVLTATYTAAAAPSGYTLTSVTVNGVAVAAPYIVSKPADTSIPTAQIIVANYTKNVATAYTIKSLAAPGGWISKPITLPASTDIAFDIKANTGSTLQAVNVYFEDRDAENRGF